MAPTGAPCPPESECLWVSYRRAIILAAAAAVVPAVLAACAATSRYRTLSFFFDGVPVPGASDAAPPDGLGPIQKIADAGPTKRSAPVRRYYAHPPYRENRCGGCHDRRTGRLVQEPDDGLCVSCHTDPPGEMVYVHGPVAVNACLRCHHHHTSALPRMLLAEVNELCMACHAPTLRTDLEAHGALDQGSCVDCHDPHGGSDRFFLKRVEP